MGDPEGGISSLFTHQNLLYRIQRIADWTREKFGEIIPEEVLNPEGPGPSPQLEIPINQNGPAEEAIEEQADELLPHCVRIDHESIRHNGPIDESTIKKSLLIQDCLRNRMVLSLERTKFMTFGDKLHLLNNNKAGTGTDPAQKSIKSEISTEETPPTLQLLQIPITSGLNESDPPILIDLDPPEAEVEEILPDNPEDFANPNVEIKMDNDFTVDDPAPESRLGESVKKELENLQEALLRNELIQDCLRKKPIIQLERLPIVSFKDIKLKSECEDPQVQDVPNPLILEPEMKYSIGDLQKETEFHEEPKKSYNCTIGACRRKDQGFSSASILKRHITQVHKIRVKMEGGIPVKIKRVPIPIQENVEQLEQDEFVQVSSEPPVSLMSHLDSILSDSIVRKKKPPPRTLYKCFRCETEYSTPTLLRLHKEEKHDLEKNICTICDKISPSPGDLRHHMLTHKANRTKTVKCTVCPKLFYTKIHMMDHFRNIHEHKSWKPRPPPKEGILCEICAKTYKSLQILNLHKKYRHSGLSFLCQTCGASFQNDSGLKRHIKREHTDSGAPQFTCEKCGAQFKEERHFKLHQRNMHGPKTLKCPHCDKMFGVQGYLRAHIKSAHEKAVFKCTVNGCQKEFASKFWLKEHIGAVHEGKLLTCHFPNCGKTYKYDTALKDHVKSFHKGIRSFKCEFCEMSFAQGYTLRRHIGRRHKDKVGQEKQAGEDAGISAD